MNVNEILEMMNELLDNAWSIPLSGGRSVVDIDQFRDLIDDVRLHLPSELKQAKLIVSDRKSIIEDAKHEAETIVRVAEERARRMVDEEEIVKQAKEKSKEIIQNAQTQSKELRKAASDFADMILKNTEQGLVESMNQVKAAKAALRKPSEQPKAAPTKDANIDVKVF